MEMVKFQIMILVTVFWKAGTFAKPPIFYSVCVLCKQMDYYEG